MEILFCELCNESVPQADLDAGRAYYRKGRLICAVCDAAMGGESVAGVAPRAEAPETPQAPGAGAAGRPTRGSAPATRHRERAAPRGTPEGPVPTAPRGSGGVLVGMLAIAFAAAGFWTVLDRLDRMERDGRAERNDLDGDIAAARSRHEIFKAGLPGQLAGVEERIEERQLEQRQALIASIDALRRELDLSGAREDAVAKELAAISTDLDKVEQNSRERAEAATQNQLSLEKDLRFYSDRLIELEESLRTLSSRAGVIGAPAAGSGQPAAPSSKPWEGLLADLQHTNAGIRLDAIYALGETGDREVVPHLIPMLEDVDLFVRMATARMLEELDARTATPALIDALEDGQSAVREAAMVALRQITGKEFRFEPVATDGERAKKVKLWREWWRKYGEEFLTGA